MIAAPTPVATAAALAAAPTGMLGKSQISAISSVTMGMMVVWMVLGTPFSLPLLQVHRVSVLHGVSVFVHWLWFIRLSQTLCGQACRGQPACMQSCCGHYFKYHW